MSATERLAEADRILNLPTAREYVAAMLLELADTRTKTAILVDAVEQSWTHPTPSVRAACKRAREAAEGNRVTAGTGVDIDQRTEWAIWFDADDPNDPNADIFGKDDEEHARYALIAWESYSAPDDLDRPVSVGQVSVPIYGDVWHDDAWRVDLRTAEGDTGSVWVDRETFEQLVIGQYADLGGTS